MRLFLALSLASAPALAKETREPFGAADVVRETENFALHWQTSVIALDDSTADDLLAGFERSYATLHDELGYALPRCADSARVNAYVSSAQGTPSIENYGGMMSVDDDGCAFLILSHDMITSGDPGTQLVVTHEYFHAVQFGTDAFAAPPDFNTGIDPRGWYFEATANWAVTQVYPDEDVVFGDLRSYLAGTEHSLFLTMFDVSDASPVFAHEYGAFLFATFIEHVHGGRDVIRDSWRDARPDDDPILFLAERVGVAPGALLAQFGAHNATWNYPTDVRAKIEAWLPFFDVTLVHGSNDSIDAARPLHAFGYHLVALDVDAPSTMRITADPTGDRGTPTSLHALVVRDDDSIVSASEPVDEHARFLVIACDADTRDPHETFGYTLDLTPLSDEPSADPPAGCGASGFSSSYALLALLSSLVRRLSRSLRT
jgi:hypothetical protein